MTTSIVISVLRCGFAAALVGAFAACTTSGDHVVAATGTVIGLEVAQGATGSPAFKLGYNRAELAYVPTNRSGQQAGSPVTGAEDTAEVLMELRYNGIGSTSGESGIYQRLAVGKVAVTQAGASVMFAKGADGKLDPNAADAIKAANKAVMGIPESDPSTTAERARLGLRYLDADAVTQARYDEAAEAAGYSADGSVSAFRVFAGDNSASKSKIATVKAELKSRSINPDAP